jgi:hypothetical protein
MPSGPYRAGPWPGLTPQGAGVLLGCALFLAIGQTMIGPPRQPLPDLPVVGGAALLPLAIAVRIVRMPGAASATCGAYLLPRSVIGLFQSILDQPPLLLVPTVGFEVVLWLLWTRAPRLQAFPRAALAGALFGLALGLIEPPYRVFLGADPATWSGPALWLATAITSAVCAAVGTVLSARGTGS